MSADEEWETDTEHPRHDTATGVEALGVIGLIAVALLHYPTWFYVVRDFLRLPDGIFWAPPLLTLIVGMWMQPLRRKRSMLDESPLGHAALASRNEVHSALGGQAARPSVEPMFRD